MEALLALTTTELRRLAVLQRCLDGTLTQAAAADELNRCERQIRRWLRRLEAEGPAGIASRRRGRRSNRALPADVITTAVALVAQRYRDFGPTLANEKLRSEHGITLSTETLRQALIAANVWKSRRPKRAKLHPLRERRERFGDLLQLDGSVHRWFEERAGPCTLLVGIDDATSRLQLARFVTSETAWNYLEYLHAYVERFGCPAAIYVDRHGAFRSSKDVTGAVYQTQVGRALDELDIELLCAPTPQAKGRVERANRTLQHRLVRELRLRQISDMDSANAFLAEFIDDYNHRFSISPRDAAEGHRVPDAHVELGRVFKVRVSRIVSKDLTVQFNQHHYQLRDATRARRLRGLRVDLVLDRNDVVCAIEHQRSELAFVYAGTTRRPAPIVDPRDGSFGDYIDRRRRGPDPTKARTPKPSHPWRSTTRSTSASG